MTALLSTSSISSIIRLALGITFWYLKTSLLSNSNASFTDILLYRFWKSTVNKKQSLSIFVLPSSLTRLRLSFKMFSNLEQNVLNGVPRKLMQVLKSSYILLQLVVPRLGFPIYKFLTLKIQPPFLHMAFYNPF